MPKSELSESDATSSPSVNHHAQPSKVHPEQFLLGPDAHHGTTFIDYHEYQSGRMRALAVPDLWTAPATPTVSETRSYL